jgi:protein TonB
MRTTTIILAFFFMFSCHAQVTESTPASNKPDASAVVLKTNDDVPVRFCDQMPEFPGGIDSLYQFIRANISYPPHSGNIQGTVVVEFVIEKEGTIGKVNVIAKAHPLLDAEAVRVVKLLPKWKPGKIKGKPTAVWYTLPVAFSIN